MRKSWHLRTGIVIRVDRPIPSVDSISVPISGSKISRIDDYNS